VSRVRVWDLPTRTFHWSIALLIPALWWTAREEDIETHMMLGQVMLGLVLFRLLWGLMGSSTARFAGFVKGPGAVLAYLRGMPAGVGHSPLGALSVMAMLLALAVQVGLGLFATDSDGINMGPLAHLVSPETSDTLTDRHETMFNLLLALIGLHLAAILFYLLAGRRNLVTPMVTGKDEGEAGMTPAPAWRFAVCAGLALALTLAITRLL